MWKIVIGMIMIVGGLSGHLALRGAGSGEALAVFGGILFVWGLLKTTIFRSGGKG
jgi:hypothetical protein